MSTCRLLLLGVAALAILPGVGGCRKSAPTYDTGPFKAAIESYLQDHQMGLRVVEFKELTVEAAKAQATVSLEHAEGMVGVKVRWTFWLEKRGGQWVAVRHKQS